MTSPLPLTTRAGLALGLFLLATSVPGSAHAEAVAHRTQFQLQTGILGLSNSTTKVSGSPQSKSSGFGVGVLGRSAVGIGHAWSEHVALHVLAGLAVNTGSYELDDNTKVDTQTVTLSLLPTLRYIGGSESSQGRIFVGGGLGADVDGSELTLLERRFRQYLAGLRKDSFKHLSR